MKSERLAELGPDSLVGAYRVVREIGRGGMATVYEAAHTVLPRRAALKVMHGALLRQPGMATRMVQEAAILEELRHPGVVRVHECNLLPDHRPWIAMELVEGETLANRLHYASTLPALEVATLLGDVADVLATAHKAGIVHRDLKPDNLLCTPTDREFPVRVLDWGVARLGLTSRLTLDGLTPGTPIYMSPEQAAGRDIAPPCDIYSLGVIAYELLTGTPPFDGRTLAEVVCMHLTREPLPLSARCRAPKELCDLVAGMLQKDPALRPCALEVRQVSRAIALELSQAYEEFELTGIEERIEARDERIAERSVDRIAEHRMPAAPARRKIRPAQIVTDESYVIDADALEYGVTEMLPVVPRPRWTPEIGRVPTVLAVRHHGAIGPRAPRDQVAGEIILNDT
jgi:serine/threonine protein kinase